MRKGFRGCARSVPVADEDLGGVDDLKLVTPF